MRKKIVVVVVMGIAGILILTSTVFAERPKESKEMLALETWQTILGMEPKQTDYQKRRTIEILVFRLAAQLREEVSAESSRRSLRPEEIKEALNLLNQTVPQMADCLGNKNGECSYEELQLFRKRNPREMDKITEMILQFR